MIDFEKVVEKIVNWGFFKNVGFYIFYFGFFLMVFGDLIVYGYFGEYVEILGFIMDKGVYFYLVIGILVMILKLL